MSRITYLAVCAALALATSACGDTPGQRALTGGAIGAGGGALVGAAAGNPLAGAVVGGLDGARPSVGLGRQGLASYSRDDAHSVAQPCSVRFFPASCRA